ncbi:MAG: hypothetical protein ACK4VO_03365 [Pseudobdellovibrio sp.]
MFQRRSECYCAFCKNTRKVYLSKHLNLAGVVGLVLLSYVVTSIIWQEADIRGLAILGVLLIVAEAFTRLRWRQSMICGHCGFDPVIYVQSPDRAAQKIQNYMRRRTERPEFLLKPALKLPQRKQVERQSTDDKRSVGSQLSIRG